MIKRGIFGGTFNPIHVGHVNLALAAIEKSNLDILTVVPAGNPYHKKMKGVIDIKHRLNMCRLAFKDYPNIEISDIDSTEKNSYTFSLLHNMKAIYPDDTLVFILGSDMLLNLGNWKNSGDILSLAEIHCLVRDDEDIAPVLQKAEEYRAKGGKITLINGKIIEISSTEVRDNVLLHEKDIPNSVFEYILQNKLFGINQYDYSKIIKNIKLDVDTKLKKERAIHSNNVADAAVTLAKKYNVDESEAYLAGIAHDICKNLSANDMLHLILKSDIIYDSAMLKQKNILHGLAAAEYLWHEKSIYNLDILNAVRFHTIARADMSDLEKVIYVADLISIDRDYPDLDLMRNAANSSLEEGMCLALRFTIKDLADRKLPICNYTAEAYNFYCTD